MSGFNILKLTKYYQKHKYLNMFYALFQNKKKLKKYCHGHFWNTLCLVSTFLKYCHWQNIGFWGFICYYYFHTLTVSVTRRPQYFLATQRWNANRKLREWFTGRPADVRWRVTDWKMVLNETFYVLMDWS